MGLPALLFLAQQQNWLPQEYIKPIWYAYMAGFVAVLLAYLHLPKIVRNLPKLPKLKPYLGSMPNYAPSLLQEIFGISFIRHCVIILQFGFAFRFFGYEPVFEHWVGGVCLMLMSKSIMPALGYLTDLGIRQATALVFFSYYGFAEPLIISVTLLVWLVNVLAPTLAGLSMYWSAPALNKVDDDEPPQQPPLLLG
jgi:hypothetical protein